MIATNPNPPMSKRDTMRFAAVMRKVLTKKFSPKEQQERRERINLMREVTEAIRRNNGGTDPILGY